MTPSLVLLLVLFTPTGSSIRNPSDASNLAAEASWTTFDAQPNDDGPANLDFGYYDRLRRSDGASAPFPDVTRVPVPETGEVLTLRHLAMFTALTRDGKPQQIRLDAAACAILAVSHWNAGDGAVVPRINEATRETCPDLKFTLELFDSEFGPIAASRRLAKDILPRRRVWDPKRPYPTALTGALRSFTAGALGTLSATAARELVLVSASSTSEDLDNKGQYPLFGRTIPSDDALAYWAVDYLAGELGVTHLGILHVRDSFGLSFAKSIQDAAARWEPPVKTITASYPYGAVDEPRLIADTVRWLKDSGFNYFVHITFDNLHALVMTEAYKQGMAGPGKYWMYGEAQVVYNISESQYPALDSDGSPNPVVAATTGSALLQTIDPSDREGDCGHDAFMRAWRSTIQTDGGQKYLRTLMPDHVVSGDNSTKQFWRNFSFTDVPIMYAFNQYDAVVALALAACEQHNLSGGGSFTGTQLYESFVRTEFDGCYGSVAFDNKTGSRDYRSVPYTVKNIVANEPDADGLVSFRTATTNIVGEGGWRSIEGEEFIYSDGTTAPPDVLPPVEYKKNLIPVGVQIGGLVLYGLTFALSIGFGFWTFWHSMSPVVKASQPIFLFILCLGTLLIASAIIPLSLQEPHDQKSLDIACMSVPWLISFGFSTVFAALCSKLLRVNKIFFNSEHFRHVTVTVLDVMTPFLALLTVNVAVLIAWTVVAPLTHQRVYKGAADIYGRSLESYATCYPASPGANQIVFTALWVATNLLALLFANFQAYKARKIAVTYSESKYIGISMAFMLQICIISIPSVIVTWDLPTERFLIACLTIVGACWSILLPVFVPKLLFLHDWNAEAQHYNWDIVQWTDQRPTSLRFVHSQVDKLQVATKAKVELELIARERIRYELSKMRETNSLLRRSSERKMQEISRIRKQIEDEKTGLLRPQS